jgi:phosphohistidine phosphatase
MDLYLIRHADAGTPVNDPDADAQRPLSKLGHTQARELAVWLTKLGVRLDAIVSSPLARAVQTSEEMLAHLPEPLPTLHVHEEVGLDLRPRKVVKFLRDLGKSSLAVVGHQPTLGMFAAWLIGSKKAHIEPAKAGVAKITGDELGKADGTLVWLSSPEWYQG